VSPAATRPDQVLGLIEWLRPGEHARAEAICDDMAALGIKHLRTHLSWADWHRPEGRDWYDWLLPYLARRVEVLPCFTYTPPSLGIEPKTASPPRDPKAFADFIDIIITRLGAHFEWIELWNEANNRNDWDWHLDPSWEIFSAMIGNAAYWSRQRGKRTLLGGMAPLDPNWLDLMCRRGTLRDIDAIGVHGFPGTWEFDWEGWPTRLARIREILDRHGLATSIWITEAGYSTWRHDEYRQIEEFLELVDAPAERVYWYSGYDLHPETSHQDGFHEDERHYHFGLKSAEGRPKLLYRILAERGLPGLREFAESHRQMAAGLCRDTNSGQRRGGDTETALITGGCGFIGTALADRLLRDGREVLLLDNLSRSGVERNLDWLTARHASGLKVAIADIRDRYLLRTALDRVDSIFHLAAQVAVTTSLTDPQADFDVNAKGTLNLLDAVRRSGRRPRLIFTSTNKVYGGLQDLALRRRGDRWEPVDAAIRAHGIGETRPLEFCSPYGCSKGAADQYMLEFGRSYGLPTIVLRMSCIYGPHQFGNEDQGWVAHFLMRALAGQPLTLYGDGAQVRDVLYVDDLIDALLLAERNAEVLGPRAYNIGGGPANTVSLLELLGMIEDLGVVPPTPSVEDWRPADQRYYASDCRRFQEDTGWRPRWTVDRGLESLLEWLISADPAYGPGPAMGAITAPRPGRAVVPDVRRIGARRRGVA
jgi:CDP-paratose 2-epimerase